MKRARHIKVRVTDTEYRLFALYSHRCGRSMSSALRSAVKSEIRRHRGRVEEFRTLLALDDEDILAALRED